MVIEGKLLESTVVLDTSLNDCVLINFNLCMLSFFFPFLCYLYTSFEVTWQFDISIFAFFSCILICIFKFRI